MGRQLVVAAVARHEADRATADVADDDGRRRLAVRGVDLDLTRVVEQLVETRAAEDADLDLLVRHGYALLDSLVLVSAVLDVSDDVPELSELSDDAAELSAPDVSFWRAPARVSVT
jgi:phage tail protein X